jgi:alginate O-acetyltransferase complex protein AlgJ
MSSESCTSRVCAFCNALTVVIFLGLIWMPTLDHFFKLDHADAPGENRLPAKWPVFKGLGDSREFVSGVEAYFNDHFGFRKRLVRLNNHWKGQLFHDPGSKDVLIGRDGWLFYSGGEMIAHYTGTELWSERELENWRKLLEGRRDWLRARGAKYLLVLPPDKQRVYPEYLPTWLAEDAKPGKVQQLVDYMKAHSTVEILDLTQALVQAKKLQSDYFQTDTHWNMFGGFVAYRAVIEALSRQIPGLTPLPLDTFTWTAAPPPKTDLARMLGRPESYPEGNSVVYVPQKPFTVPKVQFDPVRFPHKGPDETRPCFTVNPNGSGKVMVFHDSFACVWYNFLAQHFKEVVYVWQYDWNKPLIERERPDVVIDEILERFLNEEDPVALAHKDQLSETKSAISGR